jgi:hypothetical protein
MYGNYWRRELGNQKPTNEWLITDCFVCSFRIIETAKVGRYWRASSIVGINGHIQFSSPKEAMAAQDAVMMADGHYLIEDDEIERFEKMAVLL